MDLTQLANLGEFIGGVAVVASLAYLAMQVRRGNENARQTFELERNQANREMSAHFAKVFGSLQDESLFHLMEQAMSDWGSLSKSEQGRAAAWLGEMHLHTVSTFLASRQGLMDEDYAAAWIDWYVGLLKTPGLLQWWATTRPTHHQGFVRHIDSRIAAQDGPQALHLVLPWFAVAEAE